MKYLKRPDGTIEQFEDERFNAYNLDRQIAEQKGEDFGVIYDVESLPDEDKVKLGFLTLVKYTSDYKISKISELSNQCKIERSAILDDVKIMNVLSGATAGYPEYLTPSNVAKFIEIYKNIYHTTSAAINSAANVEEINAIMSGIEFPTLEQILAQLQGA